MVINIADMELNKIIRMILEEQGIEYLLSDKSTNYIKDLCPNISSSVLYIWQSLLRDSIIEELLNTSGGDSYIRKIAYKFSIQTGFNSETVYDLLRSLSLGIMQAYWGIKPKDEPLNLLQRFIRNKSNWEQRLLIYKSGILRVLKNDKYGFIASNGEVFIIPTFKSAGLFNDGLACVHTFDDQLYFINILGNMEIDLNTLKFNQSSEVDIMYYGISKYQTNGKYGLISCDGKHTDCLYDWISIGSFSVIAAYKDGKCGLINKSDLKEKASFKYENIDIVNNSNQFYSIATYSNGEKVILDFDGKETPIEPNIVRIDFINNLIFLFDASGRLKVLNNLLEESNFHYGVTIDDRFGRILHRTTIDIPDSPILYFRRRYGSYVSGSGYIFIKSDGNALNNTPFVMAHQYNNGIAWVKKGGRWHRINTRGKDINIITRYDILTPEYNNTVLARDSVSCLIVLLTVTGDIVFTFPNTEDIDVKMNRHYQYLIETPNDDYVWYNGVLTKFKGKIDCFHYNKMLMYSNYLASHLDKSKYEIYDLETGRIHIIELQCNEDRIYHSPTLSKLQRGLICCRTLENNSYLIDIYKNLHSEVFDEIIQFSTVPIGRREEKDFLMDSDLKIICSFNQIVSQ